MGKNAANAKPAMLSLSKHGSRKRNALRQAQGYGFERTPNGFTLLEMMVALAVFSLAALALIRLQAYTIRTASEVERITLARIVAQNIATDILTDPAPPSLGTEQGSEVNGGVPWGWRTETKMTEDARIMRIDIGVASPDGGAPYILTVVRPLEL